MIEKSSQNSSQQSPNQQPFAPSAPDGASPQSSWRDSVTYVNEYGGAISRSTAERERAQPPSETSKLKKVAVIQAICSLVFSIIALLGAFSALLSVFSELIHYGHLIGEGAAWSVVILTWGVVLPVPILPLAVILSIMSNSRYEKFLNSGGVDPRWQKLNAATGFVCCAAVISFALAWASIFIH